MLFVYCQPQRQIALPGQAPLVQRQIVDGEDPRPVPEHQDTVPLRYDGPESLLAPKGGEPSYALTLPASVPAPVEEGARVGTLRVSLGGETLAEVPVCAAEAVRRIGFGGMALRLAGSLVGL